MPKKVTDTKRSAVSRRVKARRSMSEANTFKKKERTKKIPINDVKKHDTMEKNQHFALHVEPGISPKENPVTRQRKQKKNQSEKKQAKVPRKKSKISRKIWNFMEWVAVSALIFVVLFFIINFASYSEIIKSKIEKLTGNFKLDPYIEKMVAPEDGVVTQEPLPLTSATKESKQQIPPLDIEISPPDERIIIPRINKNVPIVQVSSENLIRRDWNGLEADIQGSLRDGVVHYPGTAQAGDLGNVVLTGHSSYFPWDPGRFKDVFALLHEIIVGDTIVVYHDQQKFNYIVYKTEVVTPDKVEILTQEGEDRLTLITCTPVGTNLKRLIVYAKPLS